MGRKSFFEGEEGGCRERKGFDNPLGVLLLI
jgi:hypothetical protein